GRSVMELTLRTGVKRSDVTRASRAVAHGLVRCLGKPGRDIAPRAGEEPAHGDGLVRRLEPARGPAWRRPTDVRRAAWRGGLPRASWCRGRRARGRSAAA